MTTRKSKLVGPSATEREAMLFGTRPQLLHWTCTLRSERDRLAREMLGQQAQSTHAIPKHGTQNNPLKRRRNDGLSDRREPSRHPSAAPMGGSDTSRFPSPIDGASLCSDRSLSSATIYDILSKDELPTKSSSHYQPTSPNRQNHEPIASSQRLAKHFWRLASGRAKRKASILSTHIP